MASLHFKIVGVAVSAALLLATSETVASQERRWTLQEAVRIGAVDGPNALASVASVSIGNDGTVYIADQLVRLIRVYSSEGRLLKTFGGRGSGPGEFEAVGDIAWIRDTLIVADPTLQRFSRFTRTGSLIEAFRVAPPGTYLAVGLFRDGSALVRPQSREYARHADRLMPLLRTKSGVADTIAWVRAYGSGACAGRRVIVCMRSDPPTADIVRVDPHSEYVMVVSNLRPQTRTRQAFVVTKLGPDGDTLMKSRVLYTPSPVPRSYLDSLTNHWSNLLRNPPGGRPALTRDEAAEVIRDGLQLPEFYPPVFDAIVAQNGDVWLEIRSSSGIKGWLVLDRNGHRKGRVSTASSHITMHAVHELAWAVVPDEWDVPYVVGYRIQESAPARR